MDEQQPIAAYHETRLEGRRLIELFRDRVIVKIEHGRGRSELAVNLSDLSPIYSRMFLRSGFYGCGLMAFLLPWPLLVGWLIFSAIFLPQFDNISLPNMLVLPTSLSFVGLIVVLAARRKVEYACFMAYDGTPVLAIARNGKDAKRFEPFINAVANQIDALKAS